MSRNLPVTKLAVTDIETFDKVPSSIVFAIGCVVIDIKTLEKVSEFYTVINPKQKGRTSGNGTPEWWLNQSVESPEAFKELQAAYASSKTLKAALYELGSFLDSEFNGEPVNMFGNGPEFDNAILDNAFVWAGLKTPWPYWGNQSIRTSNLFMQLFGSKPDIKFEGIKHHALHDSRHEAKLLIEAIRQQKPRIKIMSSASSFSNKNVGKVVFFDELDKFDNSINKEKIKQASRIMAEQGLLKPIQESFDSIAGDHAINSHVAIEKPRPYADAWQKIVETLDSISIDWRKDGKDCCESAVAKIKEMASAIDICDLEKISGEYQTAHRYMGAIINKLRSHGIEVHTYRQCASLVDSLLFQSESQRQRAECFEELLKVLREANEGSFDRECPSSLLEDCKHAIGVLCNYKKEYQIVKRDFETLTQSSKQKGN